MLSALFHCGTGWVSHPDSTQLIAGTPSKEDDPTPTQLPHHSPRGDELEVSTLEGSWRCFSNRHTCQWCISAPDKALSGCGYALLGCMWSERPSLDVPTWVSFHLPGNISSWIFPLPLLKWHKMAQESLLLLVSKAQPNSSTLGNWALTSSSIQHPDSIFFFSFLELQKDEENKLSFTTHIQHGFHKVQNILCR